jgi:hypothetical protein
MVFQNNLEEDFHHAMIGIYEKAKDACDYKPTRFLQMVQEYGGVRTAKRLLARSEVQSGLETLWECHRLDLSMEALVLKPRFQSLFTEEELKIAKDRLILYGYQFVNGSD